MRRKFSLVTLAMATVVTLLSVSAVGHAQTTPAGASAPTNSTAANQAQKNPVGPAQNDGKSGQSARPWPSDSSSASDPGLNRPVQ